MSNEIADGRSFEPLPSQILEIRDLETDITDITAFNEPKKWRRFAPDKLTPTVEVLDPSSLKVSIGSFEVISNDGEFFHCDILQDGKPMTQKIRSLKITGSVDQPFLCEIEFWPI